MIPPAQRVASAARLDQPAHRCLLPTIAAAALALLVVLPGCSTSPREREANAARAFTPPPLVLVPLDDGKMAKLVPMPGSGATLTSELARALRAARADVVVAESASAEDVRAAAGSSRLLVCGNFLEWEPDMAVALVAVTVDGVVAARSHVVIQYGRDLRNQTRSTCVPRLADEAVDKLMREMRRANRETKR